MYNQVVDVQFQKSRKVQLVRENQAKLLFAMTQIGKVLLEKLLLLQLTLMIILF